MPSNEKPSNHRPRTRSERSVADVFKELKKTDFKRSPFRGLISQVALDAKLDRRTVHKRIFINHNMKLALKLLRIVQRVGKQADNALRERA